MLCFVFQFIGIFLQHQWIFIFIFQIITIFCLLISHIVWRRLSISIKLIFCIFIIYSLIWLMLLLIWGQTFQRLISALTLGFLSIKSVLFNYHKTIILINIIALFNIFILLIRILLFLFVKFIHFLFHEFYLLEFSRYKIPIYHHHLHHIIINIIVIISIYVLLT